MQSILSSIYDKGKRSRLLYLIKCQVCSTEIWVPKHLLNKRKFCSTECVQNTARTKVVVLCDGCQEPVERSLGRLIHPTRAKSGYIFCTQKCKSQSQRVGGIKEIQPSHYGTGLTKYRRVALARLKNECSRCEYREHTAMLDVHHIDGNRSNNQLHNLEILCVWCHALITRKIIPYSGPYRNRTDHSGLQSPRFPE